MHQEEPIRDRVRNEVTFCIQKDSFSGGSTNSSPLPGGMRSQLIEQVSGTHFHTLTHVLFTNFTNSH